MLLRWPINYNEVVCKLWSKSNLALCDCRLLRVSVGLCWALLGSVGLCWALSARQSDLNTPFYPTKISAILLFSPSPSAPNASSPLNSLNTHVLK